MSNKIKTIIIFLIFLFSIFIIFIFIRFVSALGSDDCTSQWRLVYHNVHKEKCYVIEDPKCNKQKSRPAEYPKCLTQPNCISTSKLIKVKNKECLDQLNLGCEAVDIELNPALNLCQAPDCYNVSPSLSCKKEEMAQTVKFVGDEDPRCDKDKNAPQDKAYCSCKAFSDEDLLPGKDCDYTSSNAPLYENKPAVNTLTPFCKDYQINIQRVCSGAPKINQVYLSSNPSLNYGPPGSEITIIGLNLSDTIKVEVGGKQAQILSAESNQVKVKIDNNADICANSVVLTTQHSQTKVSYLLDSAVTDTPVQRSAEGYFIVVDEKISSAELENDTNNESYGAITFTPDKGVFGTILSLENNKGVLGNIAGRSWVSFAGDIETRAEFYAVENIYWDPYQVLVKVPRDEKAKIQGKIRVHLCDSIENRDVYLETIDDFKLGCSSQEECKPKISYFIPNFGVNMRQWQKEKDPYNLEYQEEISLFGRNFDDFGDVNSAITEVYIIDKNGAEISANFKIISYSQITVFLPEVNLPDKALELYFGKYKVCNAYGCDIADTRFYLQDYSPYTARQPAIQAIKTFPEKAVNFDFNPPYFYKLNQNVQIIGRSFGDLKNDSKILFWSPDGYLEAGRYNKWSNRELIAAPPNKALSAEPEYKDFSRGTLPILVCTKKYGCNSSLNYYHREKFEIPDLEDPNKKLTELGQPEIVPEIFHIDTSCAMIGQTITIRGYNFWDKRVDTNEGIEYYVTFDGVKANVYPFWSAEKISVVVPSARTGRVGVHRIDKNSEEKIGFSDEILTICNPGVCTCPVSTGYCFSTNQLPEIYQVLPAAEYIGLNRQSATTGAQEGVITIKGCNLGKESGASYALFNDIKHNKILSWNSYEVKTWVPFSAPSGKISLYIWDGSKGYHTNELDFHIKPVVQKVLPSRGSAQQVITVLGSDFCRSDSCLDLPKVYLSFYKDLGLAGVPNTEVINFNRRQIQFKLDRGIEDNYNILFPDKKVDYTKAVYSGLLYVKRTDGILSRPYQTETRGHFGYFFELSPNFLNKTPLLQVITPDTAFANEVTKILLKGENFYGTANIPVAFADYAYGTYPKTRIWNYFVENLNLETKEDYLVKQGTTPDLNKTGDQSLESQELVSTNILSPFTQKSGIINRHSLLGINYDGSFGMFFKSGLPRLDLRPIVSYESEKQKTEEKISLKSGRAYYGYWSYGRSQIPKIDLLSDAVIPFNLKIKNPDPLREDPDEKAEIEFKLPREWFQKVYNNDRISLTQKVPQIDQQGIFDIYAKRDELKQEVDFSFSFYNGIERYYQCNFLTVADPKDKKIIVCNSEPYFPGVIPRSQFALAGYGFFQTNLFVIDCAQPQIKNIPNVSGLRVKVFGDYLNNVSVTIDGKGYKSGYSSGVLTVSLSKKLLPGIYTLRAKSKDRCATYPRYDEKKFRVN